MDLQLTDRVALVAGSSKGIGRAIASSLLREGCKVCITGRDSAALDTAREEMRAKFGDRVVAIRGDFTEASAIDAAYSEVNRTWGGPDILVANIGSGSGKPGWQQEENEWDRLFNLNFFGSVRLAQAVIPYMQPRGGSILFVGSIAAVEATPAPFPYSAAKAALLNYSKNLSCAVAADKFESTILRRGTCFSLEDRGIVISQSAVRKSNITFRFRSRKSGLAGPKRLPILLCTLFLRSRDLPRGAVTSWMAARREESD